MKRMILGLTLMACSALSVASDYNLPGFVTEIEDGRLWVFKKDSKELEEFKKHGEPVNRTGKFGGGFV
ncbi:hypothetical protein GCM10007891_03580 [Methylophaga thalassica]|uniref:Uncharacterized protein n=1 Tax=Methylophaga thalassica TaxID=40223 RepID=A0ABQ5TQD2_9GAMM|nr:hypothetical protein [Methylophaga thalassica]GLP98504.1 hypothetical protein GCM10007891_03580 [Methylophaga thalassica]